MWTSLLGFLKSPKILGIVALSVVTLTGGWFFLSTVEEKGRLETQLEQTKTEVTNLELTLKEEKERFSQKIENYESLITGYNESIKESNDRRDELLQEIESVKEENELLQQCFETRLPDSVLDLLFDEEKKL